MWPPLAAWASRRRARPYVALIDVDVVLPDGALAEPARGVRSRRLHGPAGGSAQRLGPGYWGRALAAPPPLRAAARTGSAWWPRSSIATRCSSTASTSASSRARTSTCAGGCSGPGRRSACRARPSSSTASAAAGSSQRSQWLADGRAGARMMGAHGLRVAAAPGAATGRDRARHRAEPGAATAAVAAVLPLLLPLQLRRAHATAAGVGRRRRAPALRSSATRWRWSPRGWPPWRSASGSGCWPRGCSRRPRSASRPPWSPR